MKIIRKLRALMMKLMGLPDCREVEDFAYAYLEGQLDLTVRVRFERHLALCANCKRFVASYRAVARPDRLARPPQLDPDFERRVAQFLEENCVDDA